MPGDECGESKLRRFVVVVNATRSKAREDFAIAPAGERSGTEQRGKVKGIGVGLSAGHDASPRRKCVIVVRYVVSPAAMTVRSSFEDNGPMVSTRVISDRLLIGRVNGDGQTTRRRRHHAPITEKGRGRNLKIPDSVFRRVELEAIERGSDKSKIVTALLNRHIPHFNLTKIDRPAEGDCQMAWRKLSIFSRWP